jgi:cation:H+ antiporter
MVVNASVRLQAVTGLGEITVGAVFVSVATTLPEVFVSVIAVVSGDDEIAVGNAVGSMIFNMAVCVAVYLFAEPQAVERRSVLNKSLFLLAMLSAVMLFSLNNRIGMQEGICLLVFFVLFLTGSYKRAGRAETPAETRSGRGMWQIAGLFAAGQLLLVFGAWLLVSFGERIAHTMNIAESTVAIIFIAVGTGLPELFTAITSIRKKHNGIALGNILGSCILNCTLLLGSSSVIAGGAGLPISNGILCLSLPVMVLSTLAAILPIILTQKTKRRYGVLLVAVYAAYLFLLCR